MKHIIVLSIALSLCLTFVAAERKDTKALIGKQAPDFTLHTVGGEDAAGG